MDYRRLKRGFSAFALKNRRLKRGFSTPKGIGILVVFLLMLAGQALAQPKLYIVRHAEKLDGWPGGTVGDYQPLSAEGIATAQRLAAAFQPGELAAIYSSATTRTLHTGFPLAQKLGLPLQVADACADTTAIDDFLAELERTYKPDQAVLLVTHSNIIPYLLIKAGLPSDCRKAMDFTRSQSGWLLTDYYGELFVVERTMSGTTDCRHFKRKKF